MSRKQKTAVKPKSIAIFCSRQIPVSYLATPHKSAFVQTVNHTKTFHVKQFCPIGRNFLTELMQKSLALLAPSRRCYSLPPAHS